MKLVTGKKVIDLSRIIAGPYATMVLADFGCEVIKIEAPQGDPTRQWGPPWLENQSAYFMSINRNKKSLALNLKESKCRDVLYKLVASSDAVVQNFIPGVTQKLGVDYDTLIKVNPNLVYCSVSGFGDIGSKKNFPAFDNLIQAETGFMHLTGQENGDPFKLGFAIADVVTSLYAANSVLAGFIFQLQNKRGIHVKTSLYQCAVASLINQGSNYLNGGINPHRMGNHHPNIVPYGLYNTSTQPVVICIGTPHQYSSLLMAFNLQDKAQFRTNKQRIENRADFNKMLNIRLSNYTSDEVVNKLEALKIPCGRVNNLQTLFEGQTVRQLGLVQSIGNKRFVRSPVTTSENNMNQLTAPPKFNEHGRQLLTSLGYTDSQILQIQSLNKK